MEGRHILFVKKRILSGLDGLGLQQAPGPRGVGVAAEPGPWEGRARLGDTDGARSATAPGIPRIQWRGSSTALSQGPPPAGPPLLASPPAQPGRQPGVLTPWPSLQMHHLLCARPVLRTETPRYGWLTCARQEAQSQQTEYHSKLRQNGAHGPAGRGWPALFIGVEELP